MAFWEQSLFSESYDVIIIGAGIVGISAGIHYLKICPGSRIMILEKNSFSAGASVRNAGFACYGSPTELIAEIKIYGEEHVFRLFEERYKGIQDLITLTGLKQIDYQNTGGHEIIHPLFSQEKITTDQLAHLNSQIATITGTQHYFKISKDSPERFGFQGFSNIIYNDQEALLHPAKLLLRLCDIYRSLGGDIRFGDALTSWHDQGNLKELSCKSGLKLRGHKILFATNEYTPDFIPEIKSIPARNQVILIRPEKPVIFSGCFHIDRGFIYFRNLSEYILIGGGRQMDMDREFTREKGENDTIINFLTNLLRENIIPGQRFDIVDQWSGIISFSPSNIPSIQIIQPGVVVATNLGGIGVALGYPCGKSAAEFLCMVD